MQPWERPVPERLYKYCPPERLNALTSCRVRFSQRTAFKDDHELLPDYAGFGTAKEIWRYLKQTGLKLDVLVPIDILVEYIAQSPRMQAVATAAAVKNMKSINEVGIFCLTDRPDSGQMWNEYADAGRGFVIAFDTTHAGFDQLRSPGRIGQVFYSDELPGSFLGTMQNEGAAVLFRKRMAYSFESEWRSIRLLHNLVHSHGDIFLSPFDPASVCEITIRPTCSVETELRGLTATDARYRHVGIAVQH